jgi:ketosteroid isomerase-like protein
MSQQNVEVVKRLIAAIMRRDLDAFMEGATPDVEFVTLMTDLEGSLHGREGIGTFMDNVHATVDDPAFSVEDFRDLGDAVLALGRMEGRTRHGGVQIAAPLGAIYDFRDGKAWRMRSYPDHGEALRAAGLSE